jgi:hypothetical protein
MGVGRVITGAVTGRAAAGRRYNRPGELRSAAGFTGLVRRRSNPAADRRQARVLPIVPLGPAHLPGAGGRRVVEAAPVQ